MALVEFVPDITQQDLVLNAVTPNHPEFVLEKTLFIQEIHGSREWLPQLAAKGYKYIVCFSDQPAYSVLRHSPFVMEIASKIAFPNSMSVFQLLSKNPDETEGGSLGITAANIQPKTEWFESFLQDYNNWHLAWWREVLQNSVDTCREAYLKHGRTGKIRCEIHTWENNDKVQVTVGDNGMGMSKDTLIKAFLTPGESTKRESQGGLPATGGLGKAKEMLYFAWPEWAVLTKTDEDKLGMFVKARYAPFVGDNLLKNEFKKKEHSGTRISVVMKKDKCVKKSDLEHFIEMSSFENIYVYFKEVHHKADGTEVYIKREREDDGTVTVTEIKSEDASPSDEWERLEAKNSVPKGEDPIKTLERKDGSPWAKIYHMPKARNYKEVAVRSNGLFLFSAAGSYTDIPGKVIIELIYKPKGRKWNKDSGSWEPMTPQEMSGQTFRDYGPLEMLTTGRDKLLNQHPNYWQSQLDQFLDRLKKEPKATLKRVRPKNRVRAVNKQRPKLELDELFERIKPSDLLVNPAQTLDELQKVEDNVILDALVEGIKDGSIDPQEQEESLNQFSESQKVRLKTLVKQPEIIQQLQEKLLPPGGPTPPESSEDSSSSEGISEDTISQLVEIIEKIDISAVDTSADASLYKELLDPLLKEAEKEGKAVEFSERIIQNLKWEPDFIMSDETELPVPKPPAKFNPTMFGPKERRIAKFWVETIRLVHILLDIAIPQDLEIGFLFENPGSDEYLGEYIVSEGGEEGYTQDIGAFKAVLIAPAEVNESQSDWRHRYNFNRKDVAKIVGIAFHEVIHSSRHHSKNDYGWGDHDVKMASLLTDDIAVAMRYGLLFYKIKDFCEQLYPVKGASVEGATPRIIKEKPQPGRGYYQVDCPGKKGRKPVFTTLQEAKAYIDEQEPARLCSIEAYYWPTERSDDRSGGAWRNKTIQYGKWYSASLEELISRVREEWNTRTDDSYYAESPYFAKGSAEDVWRNPDDDYHPTQSQIDAVFRGITKAQAAGNMPISIKSICRYGFGPPNYMSLAEKATKWLFESHQIGFSETTGFFIPS